MKKLFTAIFLAAAICGNGCRHAEIQKAELPENSATPAAFIAVFDYPTAEQTVIYGDAALAERRFPPCSTFKIISTLMGLNSGAVADQTTKLGYDGSKYEYESWNKDVTLKEAFQSSCLPYYKKLVGKLSKSYVQNILNRLNYGNRDISVWNSNGHNVFWVESSLLISPLEQVAVLEKIFSGNTDFSPEHVMILKECMANGAAGLFEVYGKTGTGRNHNTNFLEAWFVGFAETADGGRRFFAAHGADPERDVTSAEVRRLVYALLARATPPENKI